MKKSTLLSVLLILLILLAGCSHNVTAPQSAPKVVEEDIATEEEPAQSDVSQTLAELLKEADEVVISEDAVTFTDDSGRGAITIAKGPQKPAILFASHACLWVEAGGKVALAIGGNSAQELYTEQIGRDITQDPGVVVVAETGSGKNWDVEKIIAEQPDLIVSSTAMSGFATIGPLAEAAEIPTIALTYSGIGDFLKWFKVFSHLNGVPELFDEHAMQVARDVAELMDKAPKTDNPRVLSILPGSDSVNANLSASDMGVIIDSLGGINVAQEQDPGNTAVRLEIDLEQIYALKPEKIFVQVLSSEEETRANLESWIGGNPVWENLEAVQNGQIYFMPKHLFHQRPNLQYGASYRMMAELLYPGMEF